MESNTEYHASSIDFRKREIETSFYFTKAIKILIKKLFYLIMFYISYE